MADINLTIGGDTRSLEREIQKTVNKNYVIDLKTKGSQPLGRITGQLSEFNKSLEASNARVIAFGASAGLIYGLQSAFVSLATSVIEVEKSLQDINVILNVSSQELQKFGSELFDIAKNTGQSFQSVAQAATEFSRQGLTLEETLKRTSEALILSRLSGLDAQKSVEALTAAVNSYASQAVTATEVVNKFANVDAAFAVSSADLAEALARVGSSAAQSGVNLNELIAIVTAAQQTTARGGAVIGNSFKTIFTRLQRTKVVNLLESLGVETTDSTGQLKSTIQLLADLGRVYDGLGTQQQSSVAEAVGGVFQINILKAALADLGKEYSIYSRAVDVAANSTDQAIRRNEELNKTYAAQLNALRENITEVASTAGSRLLGPSFERLVGGANAIFAGVKESDGSSFGATLGKGILDGLAQVLAGPGLALIGGVLIKLFKDFTIYASGSVKELLGLNSASKQQAEIQKSINAILSKNPDLLNLMTQSTDGLNKAAQVLLSSLRSQTTELQRQEAVTKKIAAQLYSSGIRVVGGVPTATTPKNVPKTKAEGYIPAFSKESDDIKRGVGGARRGDKPIGPMMINGEPTIINSGEKLIQNFQNTGETAILTRDMQKSMGMSTGYIPNFAEKFGKQKKVIDVGKKYGFLVPAISENGSRYSGGQLPGLETPDVKLLPSAAVPPLPSKIRTVSDSLESQVRDGVIGAATNYTAQLQPLGRTVSRDEIEQGFGRTAGAKGALASAIGAAFEVGIATALDYRAAQRKEGGDFDVRGGANIARVQELFGTAVPVADFKVGVSKDNVESFYGKILKENKAGAFNAAEKTKNAKRQAEIEVAQKNPSWFTSKGVLKTQDLDPREVSKRQGLIDRLQSKILKTRYSNFSQGYIPNFASRRVGYLDGDVLDDPRYQETVAAEIKKLGIKGGIPEYHKYLGDLVRKARKSGNIKKFTGIFGVPGAGKSTMMLGGKSAQKADNAKARQTQRIPIITPSDINKVDEVVDTRASLVGTSRALQGGYWSELDRLMVMSSSTPEEQQEIKRRRNLRDAQIKAGTSTTAFGRVAGTSQGANLDSGYIEAMALSILGPNKTRIMGINPNFKLRRKKDDELPLVEKKKIGLSYGAFSPSTRGHLEMMQMAKKQGISPEDFIVAVSKEGGRIDSKDPHSFRTAIFDQKTRKYLAKKTFSGANVIGADPNLFMGSVPSMLEVDPLGKRRRFLSAKKGSMAFVGSDKEEKDLAKYREAGYDVKVGERTAGISGTDARAAILAADSKLISKIFADHVVSTINELAPKIRNRAEVFPEILKRVDSKIDKKLQPVLAELSTLPGRITKTTPEEVSLKITALREQRDKYQKLKQNYPVRMLRKLGAFFPSKYGIPTSAAGYIPNFADPLKSAVDRELEESGLPKNQIYLTQKEALKNKQNPAGLGVFNKRDEGNKIKEDRAIRSRSSGYIPNFADPINSVFPQVDTSGIEKNVSDIETQTSSLSNTAGALAAQLGSLALIMSLNKDSYRESLSELTKSNVETAKGNLKLAREYGLGKESRRFFAEKVVDARSGTFAQKGRAALKGGGTGLTIAAPILAETIANAIPDTTKTGRVAKAGASALGNIGAFAGTGALIGSAVPGVGTAIGAGVGAAAGALLSLPNVISELSTDLPELSAAAKRASQELNKVQSTNSALLQAYQQYTEAMESGDNVLIEKAQQVLQVALLSASEEQRNIIQSSKTLSTAQELLAAEELKRAKELKSKELAAELADVRLSSTGGLGAGAFYAPPGTRLPPGATNTQFANVEGQAKAGAALKREILSSGVFTGNSKEFIQSKKIDTTGLQPQQITEKINATLKELQVPQPLVDIINKTSDAGIAADFLNGVLEDLANAAGQTSVTMNAVVQSMDEIRPVMTSIKEQFAALATALERNINYVERAVNSQNKLNNIQASADREIQVSEQVGFPKQVLETILGANARETQDFAFKEQLANIEGSRISTSQQTTTDASSKILNDVFGALKKQVLGEQGAGADLSGITDPNALIAAASEQVNSLQNINLEKIASEINNAVKNRPEGGPDIINQDEVVKVVGSLLSEAQISQDVIQSTNTEIIRTIQESNDALNEANVLAKNQEKLLTTQTAQQMTLIRITQALNSFGGIDSFLNPPATGPDGFDNPFMSKEQASKKRAEIGVQPISTAAKGIAEILSTNPFKFNNKESIEARKESIPDLGRNFLQLVTGLRERTGGLYTPTADSRGLQYAEQGRAMGINEELKTLVQLAKSEGVKGTGAETEIKNAIRAVQEFGVDKIAKIQVAQAAGTGVPKDLIDIATQLKSPTQQRLSEIAPDLKESLAQIMETGEPQVDALNSLNAIQANSFQALVNIETSIAELVGLLAPEQDNSARNPDVFDQKIVQTPRTSPEVQYVQSNKQAFDNARSQGPQVDLKNNFNLGSITLNVQDSARFDAEFKDQMDQLREQVKTLAEQQGVKFTPTSSRGIIK